MMSVIHPIWPKKQCVWQIVYWRSVVAAFSFVLPMLFNNRYGYFRDEVDYIKKWPTAEEPGNTLNPFLAHTAWNGHITGFNLVLNPGRKMFRHGGPQVAGQSYSIAIFDILEAAAGSKLTFTQ